MDMCPFTLRLCNDDAALCYSQGCAKKEGDPVLRKCEHCGKLRSVDEVGPCSCQSDKDREWDWD